MQNTNKTGQIIVTGHSYAFPYYFKVFEFLENKDDFLFVLPRFWSAKKGKVRIKLEMKPGFRIFGLKALSYGGKSRLSGLFKGWLPGIIFLLPYLRIKFGSKVLYSCSEPNLLTTFFNGLISKILGIKLVLFTWQNVPPEKRMTGIKLKLSNTIVALNLNLADGVICGNKKAEEIVKRFRNDIKTIICPLSGIDTQKFRPGISSDWKQRLGLGDKKVLLFYGTLDERKGLDVLLKALSLIPDKLVCAVLIGTGPKKEKLLNLASELGVRERVIFLDWMSNDKLPALLNVADIFTHPSVPVGGWEEQFGYAMAEASACDIPVVATQTGSISEVVIKGKSGILVEPNNPEKLADAITKILFDNILKRNMGEYGRKYIEQNFSHAVVASKINVFLKNFRDKIE